MKQEKPSEYLVRIGITPECNFRCIYCNPAGKRSSEGMLSDKEVADFIKVTRVCGINRIHITGGEPLLRRGLIQVLDNGNKDRSIKYYLTTNGFLLKDFAKELKRVGVQRLNVSIDSLDEDKYHKITGAHGLQKILDGLTEARKHFKLIKLNMIVLREYNLSEVPEMIAYCQKNGYLLRLSELLPFSSAKQENGFFEKNFVSKREIEELLKKEYGVLKKIPIEGNNWACDYYKIKGFKTPLAIVYHHTRGYQCVEDRCKSIRVSSTGILAACYTMGYPTQNIANMTYAEKLREFKECLRVKENLKKEGYPLYHIPDYTRFRANTGAIKCKK